MYYLWLWNKVKSLPKNRPKLKVSLVKFEEFQLFSSYFPLLSWNIYLVSLDFTWFPSSLSVMKFWNFTWFQLNFACIHKEFGCFPYIFTCSPLHFTRYPSFLRWAHSNISVVFPPTSVDLLTISVTFLFLFSPNQLASAYSLNLSWILLVFSYYAVASVRSLDFT